jgi:SsrA-binding protein
VKEARGLSRLGDRTALPSCITPRNGHDAREMAAGKDQGETLIVKNRRATFDYTIDATYEGGLVLLGSEVKSLRAGKVDVVDAFAQVEKGQVWLKQLRIAPLPQASAYPHEPQRARKVLLHRHEIEAIEKAVTRSGFTMIPLKLYFKAGRVKVELGLVKGKKTIDKRHDLARKTAEREARIEMARGKRGP